MQICSRYCAQPVAPTSTQRIFPNIMEYDYSRMTSYPHAKFCQTHTTTYIFRMVIASSQYLRRVAFQHGNIVGHALVRGLTNINDIRDALLLLLAIPWTSKVVEEMHGLSSQLVEGMLIVMRILRIVIWGLLFCYCNMHCTYRRSRLEKWKLFEIICLFLRQIAILHF